MGYYDDWVEPNGTFRGGGIVYPREPIICPKCGKKATRFVNYQERKCNDCGTLMIKRQEQ